MPSFSESLKKWRKTNHYTTRQAADWLGVSASAICRWENGNREPHIHMQSAILHLITQKDFEEFS